MPDIEQADLPGAWELRTSGTGGKATVSVRQAAASLA